MLIPFRQADVFGERPFCGSSSLMFFAPVAAFGALRGVARQMGQAEVAVVDPTPISLGTFAARLLALESERAPGWQPLVAAAAALHDEFEQRAGGACRWRFALGDRSVSFATERLQSARSYSVAMHQGAPVLGEIPAPDLYRALLGALNLREGDCAFGHTPRVISTGVPFLIVPLWRGLGRAQIVDPLFEDLLREAGAAYACLLDVERLETRQLANDASFEDVATVSAAGPAAAFLFTAGVLQRDRPLVIRQGRSGRRRATIRVQVATTPNGIEVVVAGTVRLFAEGTAEVVIPPRATRPMPHGTRAITTGSGLRSN